MTRGDVSEFLGLAGKIPSTKGGECDAVKTGKGPIGSCATCSLFRTRNFFNGTKLARQLFAKVAKQRSFTGFLITHKFVVTQMDSEASQYLSEDFTIGL